MKKHLLLIILFFFTNFIFSQSFEGIIDYKIEYFSKSEHVKVEDLENSGGKSTKTYYKDGYFLDICDSDFMNYQLFRHDDKSRYCKVKIESDTLSKISINAKEKLEFKYDLIKDSDTVLGYKCNKLIVYNNTRKTKTSYYYSDKISLNPIYYKDFLDLNKNKIVEIMKSYYLRMTYENEYFIADMTAINIEEKKLDDKIFSIPNHKYLKEEK